MVRTALPLFRIVFPICRFCKFITSPATNGAELLLNVVFAICSVARLKMPAAYSEAVLPLIVLLLIVTVPKLELYTAAPSSLMLFEMVLFRTVSIPIFKAPPPRLDEFPLTVVLEIR